MQWSVTLHQQISIGSAISVYCELLRWFACV